MIFLLKLFLFLAIIFPFSAQADGQEKHALSMHENPKYSNDFSKLSYVSKESSRGGEVVLSAYGTFDTLNAFNIKGKKADGLDNLYDPLMRRVWDEPFSLYGLIAQSVIINEDRSEITYKLNPDARFHDGAPITAEDVKFSFEKHKEFGKPVTRKVYGLVAQVDIIDPQTIHFKFGDGYDAETAMILSIMRILPKHYWQDKDFGETTLVPPLGGGPYKIASLDPGRQIVYERVTDYWAADLPVNKYQYNFDQIEYDYYRDQTVSFEAFKSGEIDFWRESDIGRWKSGYSDAQNIMKAAFNHQRPEWLKAIIFNTRKPIFADKQTREALALAFPYDWINKNIFYDAYKPIRSVFPNSELASPEAKKPLLPERQRLRQATRLFKQAGWQVENGKLTKDGNALSYEILLNNPKDEKIALIYSKNLEKLGVTVNVRSVDSSQFLGRLNDFDYDMVFYRWINSLSPGNEQYIYWGSAAADQIGTRNYAGVKNEVVDQAIDKMVQAKTRQDLLSAAHDLDRELMAQYYFVPLFYKGYDNIAFTPKLKHPDSTPVYGPVFESWWVED